MLFWRSLLQRSRQRRQEARTSSRKETREAESESRMDIGAVRIFGPVDALPEASSRTKNRVREHPNMQPDQIMPDGSARRAHSQALGGVEAILFKCPDCDWLGWLPTSEIAES